MGGGERTKEKLRNSPRTHTADRKNRGARKEKPMRMGHGGG